MRRGYFKVNPDLLREMFGIPVGNEIAGADWDFPSNALNIYAKGPLFPEVREGEITPHVDLVVYRDVFGRLRAECGGGIGGRVDMQDAPQFRDWLLAHEDDIAQDINDFGDLRGAFTTFMGRPPMDGSE